MSGHWSSLLSLCHSAVMVIFELLLLSFPLLFCKWALLGTNERCLKIVNQIVAIAFNILGLHGKEIGKSQKSKYFTCITLLSFFFPALCSSRIDWCYQILPQMLILDIKRYNALISPRWIRRGRRKRERNKILIFIKCISIQWHTVFIFQQNTFLIRFSFLFP